MNERHTDAAQSEVEDLEVDPEHSEDVRGGKVAHAEIVIVKSTDKSTPTLTP